MQITWPQLVKITRLEQSFFGLPLVFSAILLSFSKGGEVGVFQWILICLSFFSARICGMVCNQLFDAPIDRQNPRTSKRLIASGVVLKKEAAQIIAGSSIIFLSACLLLNYHCFFLGSLSLGLIFFYSFLKRVTSFCHFILGAIHALSPLTCSIAVTKTLSLPILFLSLSSFFLIASSDIYYALQDETFDLSKGIYSLPARIGKRKSQQIALLMQALCVFTLSLIGISAHFSSAFFAVPIGAAFLFFYFQYAKKKEKFPFPKLFFLLNATISILLFLCIAFECL